MEEFALGLTRKAVEGTLRAIEKEAEVKALVHQDLAFITGEFQMMQAFLNTTNAERTNNNQVLRTWVRQLRDLAFDVEDWVELAVHLESAPCASPSWWRGLLSSCITQLLPSCIADLVLPRRPLDDAADEIKLLRARVEEVSQRYTRYNLVSDSDDCKPTEQPANANANASVPAAFRILREAWETQQRGLDDLDLHNLITMSGPSQVVSVWSSPAPAPAPAPAGGGDLLGATPILIKAYGDLEICKKFKRRAWVKLAHPFDRHGFRKSLLAQFYPTDDGGEIHYSQQLVDSRLQPGLNNEEKYLVILEEVSTVAEWDAIRNCLPLDSNNGSRIVVSTRQLGIALLCAGEPPHLVSHLKWSSDGQSLCAFFINKRNKNGEERARSRSEQLLGRTSEKGSLIARLKRRDTRLVSVWGIAGVGKSALVRSIYQHQEDKANYEMFSWVDMPAQFNLMDFSWHLLLDFHSNDSENKHTAAIGIMEGRDPVQECCKILCQHRCLVVIDGLRSTYDWDLIKHAFSSDINTSKSCIVVISSEKDAAEHVVRHVAASRVLIVKGLPADDARSLFTEVAPTSIKESRRINMDELTDRTITISGGLPKVIAAVGKELELARSNWHAHRIVDNYRRIDKLRGLFSWMQSYFDACSDSLKPCIFYLSIFPIHHDIRRRRLVTRWVAEGYSRDRFGSTAEDWDSSRGRSDGTTADENGEKYFFDLIELSIIQQFTTSNVCQVNGFFHGYITSRPMEENLVFALEGRCKLNSQRAGQHLTVRSNWYRDINVFQSIDFTPLRSLTVFGAWEPFLLSDKMKKRLRVLDLEDTTGVEDEHVEEMVKLLTRLKFLSLRGCKGVNRLPDSLGGMRQLQTLDVRHTSIVMLPPCICKLAMLRYIRAGNTEPWYEGNGMFPIQLAVHDEDWETTPPQEADNRGVEVPTGIQNLTALHTLGIVNVSGAGGKALLDELKKLTQVRRLKVSGINRGNIQQLFSAISGHRHLESLSVRLDEVMQYDILEELFFGKDILEKLVPPPKTLTNIKLYGEHALNLKLWIKRFPRVRLWDIEMVVTTGEHLRPLEQMVENNILRRLCVKLVQDGELHFDLTYRRSIIFQNLKIDCSSKSMVTFGINNLVEVLKVRCSSGSELRFSGLENLMSLKEVWLMGYCGDTLKRNLKQQLSNYRNGKEPVVKLMMGIDRPRQSRCLHT